MNEGEGEGGGDPSTYIVDAEINVILKRENYCGLMLLIPLHSIVH